MTINDLKQCRRYRLEIKRLADSIEELRATAERMTHSLSHAPGRTQARDHMPDYIAKLDELQRDLANKLIERERCIEAIEGDLAQLPEQQARVLTLRYVDGLSWKKVADKSHYHINHCYKIQTAAFRKMRHNAGF